MVPNQELACVVKWGFQTQRLQGLAVSVFWGGWWLVVGGLEFEEGRIGFAFGVYSYISFSYFLRLCMAIVLEAAQFFYRRRDWSCLI